ncbi:MULTISPECIES: ATP-grasp domain-containing protein [Pseudoalteromonas]|uniref:ATP-grasp domain-containing protein n=1 Tax=Pseudoalteromonas amylolytica TaxID=1859457 RepID=A0A1S1MTA3_9GAMM|nr:MULTISPECIES: ATP-grasp domain-containing protein [Pseudoalteromonas]OHU86157.1 hypothetical protein BFC16_15720 [Pseudoalteromonas sp. JW3]OHU89736.1 hypothetical protein BET10_16595 [Pseudoalteromonas amylolytica]
MRHIIIFNRLPKAIADFGQWLNDDTLQCHYLMCSKVADQFSELEPYAFDSYDDDGIVAKAYELCKLYPVDSIVTTSEFDVLRCAQLREYFDIPGQKATNALAFRDKVLMKETAGKCGVNVPTFTKAKNVIDVLSFVQSNAYPVVVKPADGAGSSGVHVIRNDEQLQHFLDNNKSAGLDIETFVDGHLYHVDGISINGKVEIIWPSSYLAGDALSFANGEHVGSYLLEKDNPLTEPLITFTKEVINALRLPDNGAFHCEVFVTKENELVLCEIGCRLAGGRIVSALNHAFNVNLYELWVKAQAGIAQQLEIASIPTRMSGMILYQPQSATYQGLKNKSDTAWMTELEIAVKEGESYGGASVSVACAASFVVVGHSETDVKQALHKGIATLEENMQWC